MSNVAARSHLFAKSALSVLIILGISQPTAAQVVSAPQWIKNCVETASIPEAAKPYVMLNKPVPTAAENHAWCVGQSNTMHPDQKISQ